MTHHQIQPSVSQCPVAPPLDDRKALRPDDGIHRQSFEERSRQSYRIADFALARQILRGDGVKQAGFKADLLERFGGTKPPVLFQEGPSHQKQRAATARFFAPRSVNTRYRGLITRFADELTDRIRTDGRADLAALSFEMAVAVAAEIVGLTSSSRSAMADRLNRFFSFSAGQERNALRASVNFLKGQVLLAQFFFRDVRPAIRVRRAEPQEDVISHLIAEGYSDREILTECLTYGAAGMATTREFITMAAWHLLDDDDLRYRFLAAEEDERIAMLEEILRVEPVVGSLYRRATEELTLDDDGATHIVPKGALVEIDLAAANTDPYAVGACPFHIDPERSRPEAKTTPAVMSFGDGAHRCPGATVAMVESSIFLTHLLSVPGIRLDRPPTVTWNPLLASYELRNAIVATR